MKGSNLSFSFHFNMYTGAGPFMCLGACKYANVNGICTASCPNGSYTDSNMICTPCDFECNDCRGTWPKENEGVVKF